MLHPKPQEIICGDGTTKTFVLSKFPAIAGREIITQYPLSAIPKLGDYKVNEEIMLKVMSYVGVQLPEGGEPIMLTTRALVDNHVPDFEALMRLEGAMIEYNCSFFGNGKASNFLEGIVTKLQTLISQTLTDSLRQSSKKS